jgi:hypothetical protein
MLVQKWIMDPVRKTTHFTPRAALPRRARERSRDMGWKM